MATEGELTFPKPCQLRGPTEDSASSALTSHFSCITACFPGGSSSSVCGGVLPRLSWGLGRCLSMYWPLSSMASLSPRAQGCQGQASLFYAPDLPTPTSITKKARGLGQ